MILTVQGDISAYYVQTLCLLFFPGSTFGVAETPSPENPEAHVSFFQMSEEEWIATARLSYRGKNTAGECRAKHADFPGLSHERIAKIMVGRAVFAAGRDLCGSTPPWGILTGVRPSKVASELLFAEGGILAAKRILRDEYFVNPKKAALAVSVASTEGKLMRQYPLKETCSVYISIPFCPTRCAYCSFISSACGGKLSLLDDYLATLYIDMDHMFATIRSLGLRVVTVYIGGGTPTVLTPTQLQELLSRLARNVDIGTLSEFTVEAGRPDTITAEKLQVLFEGGVTRISVNPQTLSDDILTAIGRRHTVADFYRAYDLAAYSGIRDINVDLIAGLPGDTFSNFAVSLDAVLALSPENVTVHSFSVKKSADFRTRDGMHAAGAGDAARSVDYSQLRTKNAGYRPYYMYRQKNTVGNLENVGYAKEGHEGLYNIFMMEELHSIFSVGAGAVTKLVIRENYRDAKCEIKRIFTPKYPYEYLRDAAKIRLGDLQDDTPSIADKILAFYEQKK